MLNGVISTALSGLFAQSRATQSHASNIANVSTIGQVIEEGVEGLKQAYQPYDSVNISTENGSVQSNFVYRDPATSTVFYPNSAYANSEGLVEVPNVSLEEEIIGLQLASNAYKANIAVIRTADELSDELLDILS